MTLILKLNLDMVRMYLHTKNEVSVSSSSKVIVCTDGHTDRQTDMTENMTYPHMRVVINIAEILLSPSYFGGLAANWRNLHPSEFGPDCFRYCCEWTYPRDTSKVQNYLLRENSMLVQRDAAKVNTNPSNECFHNSRLIRQIQHKRNF